MNVSTAIYNLSSHFIQGLQLNHFIHCDGFHVQGGLTVVTSSGNVVCRFACQVLSGRSQNMPCGCQLPATIAVFIHDVGMRICCLEVVDVPRLGVCVHAHRPIAEQSACSSMTELFGPGLKAQLLETTNLPVSTLMTASPVLYARQGLQSSLDLWNCGKTGTTATPVQQCSCCAVHPGWMPYSVQCRQPLLVKSFQHSMALLRPSGVPPVATMRARSLTMRCWLSLLLQVPDEARLLQAVCDKVGPSANKEKLLWHLRASRGKVHWAGVLHVHRHSPTVSCMLSCGCGLPSNNPCCC